MTLAERIARADDVRTIRDHGFVRREHGPFCAACGANESMHAGFGGGHVPQSPFTRSALAGTLPAKELNR